MPGGQILPPNQGCQPSEALPPFLFCPFVLNRSVSHKAGLRSLGDIHSPSPSLWATELEPTPSGKWFKNEVTWTSNPSTWNPLNLSVCVQFGDNDRDLVWVQGTLCGYTGDWKTSIKHLAPPQTQEDPHA